MPTQSFTRTLSHWSADSSATLTISAGSIDVALGSAMQSVLNTARGVGLDTGPASADAQSISAMIRGQGDSYGEALFELLNDLLAQLDANGSSLATARLDGVLTTDDGGYTAWGCVLGEANGARPPVALSISGTPEISQSADGQTTATVRLNRS